MLARIRTLANRHGKTVIISTHILPDVKQVCDHVIILAHGEVRLSQSLVVLMRPTAPGVKIRTAGDASRLIDLLRRHGHSIQTSDATSFFIEAIECQDTAPIWELAAATETGVLSMVPLGNSLEQIFMDSVREVQHANS